MIAGSALLPSGLGRAVVWHGSKATNLGVIAPYDSSFAHGISSDGTIVGELNFQQSKAAPFIYSHGRMRILPGLGGDFGYASGINSHGTISGTASDVAGRPHAVAWTDDGRVVHDLGIAAGDAASFGNGISEANVVVGDTDTAAGDERPAVFAHGVAVLRGAGSRFGAAEAANGAGRVVGLTFKTNGEQHATVWGPFQTAGQDLSTLPGGSRAALVAVDEKGRAVGGSDFAGDPNTTHAIIWPGHGPLLALRPLSGNFRRDFAVARKLGANGEVVGGSQNASGETRGTVWTCAVTQAFRPVAPEVNTRIATTRVDRPADRRLAWLLPPGLALRIHSD